jgi:hypothetical protein
MLKQQRVHFVRKAPVGNNPLSMRTTVSLSRSLNAISSSGKAAASEDWRQPRTTALALGEVTMSDAINHLASARKSESNSVGPFAMTGFVFGKSKIGLFATNRNPSIHSFTS